MEPISSPPTNNTRAGILLIALVFACILIMLAGALGWIFGVERPAQAREATGTAEQNATVVTQLLTPPAAWDDIRRDDFSERWRGWTVGNTIDQGTASSIEQTVDNQYIWEIDFPITRAWWEYYPFDTAHSEAMVSVEVVRTAGLSGSIQYGIFLSHEEDLDMYFFGIQDNGEWRIIRFLQGEWATLAEGHLNTIVTGELNEVSVIMTDDTYTMIVNGTFAGELPRYEEGRRYVAIGVVSNESSRSTISFDNILLTSPD